MFSSTMPLRYKISSWNQLPECLSNNSRDLQLHVSSFKGGPTLEGFRIRVDHKLYGTLFACTIDARGEIITPCEVYGLKELTTSQILQQLARFGFFIEYSPNKHLSGPQIDYLMTLRGLGYDKIRLLTVWNRTTGRVDTARTYVVAFQSYPLDSWLSDTYCPSDEEFTKALVCGSACNLTEISKTRQFKWDWLNFVANIDDIIADNAYDMI